MNQRIARGLYDSGVKSPYDILDLQLEQIEEILTQVEQNLNQTQITDNFKDLAENIMNEANSFVDSSNTMDDLETQSILLRSNFEIKQQSVN
jgi:hypothetical protein